jgi:hypothetical protein
MSISPVFSVCNPPNSYPQRDVLLLTLLDAAAEQNNQPLAVFAKINPVAGAEIDSQFKHTGTNTFNIRDITHGEPGYGGCHFRGCRCIQSVKPNLVKVAALPVEIFSDLNHSLW